jgi:hypothetical protein
VKKSILIMLVALVMLGGISLIGCRGDTTSPGGELNWDDMPVFGYMSQSEKGNWSLPPQTGDWAKVEWRYYKFDEPYTSIAEVTMFYRNEMPKNGWEENMWMETAGASWGAFSKNGERDNAIVWISTDGDYTVFALMRASN